MQRYNCQFLQQWKRLKREEENSKVRNYDNAKTYLCVEKVNRYVILVVKNFLHSHHVRGYWFYLYYI